MPYNLLLLPLLGGFLFFHLTHFFRFGAQRLDGYRLLLQSAIAGTGLSILARFIVIVILVSPIGGSVAQWWAVFSPFSYSGTSALSLLLGPVLAALCNLFIDRDEAKNIEIRRHGNSLIQLLHRAQQGQELISVTLDSRKWYVGWVAESPNLDPQELYFRLLPFISGYRDKDSLETYRTVFYQDVLSSGEISSEEFVITLPLKDIKIAGFFNEDVYDEYFAESDDGKPGVGMGSPSAPSKTTATDSKQADSQNPA